MIGYEILKHLWGANLLVPFRVFVLGDCQKLCRVCIAYLFHYLPIHHESKKVRTAYPTTLGAYFFHYLPIHHESEEGTRCVPYNLAL